MTQLQVNPAAVPPARRRGRPGYDRERLLEVAARTFNERGYDATSMEDLSAALGISKSAIYHHVRSKQHLLRLAVDRALGALFAVIREPAATDGPAADRLRHVVRRSVEVLIAELPYVTLLLRLRGNTDLERAALARRREFDQFVAALVAEAQRDGSLRPEIDPALAGRLVFGMVNSITEWVRRGAGDDAVLADTLVHLSFDGLSRSPAA
jgi:AcrR family transcriptional regulator